MKDSHTRVLSGTNVVRVLLLAGLIGRCGVVSVAAQAADCVVSGYLFKADSSPAVNAQIAATRVERRGSAFIITPILLATDSSGGTVFTALQGSTVWIAAPAIGIAVAGDVGILIPNAGSADLNVLAMVARPVVSGIAVSSGANPVVSLNLPEFGVNLTASPSVLPLKVESVNGRSGAVALTAADGSTALESGGNTAPVAVSPGGAVPLTAAALALPADVAKGKVLTSGGVGNDPAWSATPTLAVGPTGIGTFLQATLSDHGAVGNFNFTTGRTPNAGDASRDDHNVTIGYNSLADGGAAIAGEPAFMFRIEDYYKPTAMNPQLEAHWQYLDPAGAVYRPIGLYLDRTVGGYLTNSSLVLSAAAMSYLGANGTQYVKFNGNQMQLVNGTFLESFRNNQPFLQQAKAGGVLTPLPYINAQDQIQLGTGTDVRWGTPLVPLGSGPALTLGTVGASGPQNPGQNSWMRVIDSNGETFWLPVWK